MSELSCPQCGGAGEMGAFVDGRYADGSPYGAFRMIKCVTCNGRGSITVDHSKRIELGRQMRNSRVFKQQTLLEAARLKGMTPSELSKIERGDGPPEAYGEDNG